MCLNVFVVFQSREQISPLRSDKIWALPKEVWSTTRPGSLVLPRPRIKYTFRWTRTFLSLPLSLYSAARQWKHWDVVSMVGPELLFEWETYTLYMLQLWFYQSAVKHTNHALSFKPSPTVCTVLHGAAARSVCMFAHGGSIISPAGLYPCCKKNQWIMIPSIFTDCLCVNTVKLNRSWLYPSSLVSLLGLLKKKEALSGQSAARRFKSLIVTCTVCLNKRD